jgi:hypothetical protein
MKKREYRVRIKTRTIQREDKNQEHTIAEGIAKKTFEGE